MGSLWKLFSLICCVAILGFVLLHPHIPDVQVLPHGVHSSHNNLEHELAASLRKSVGGDGEMVAVPPSVERLRRAQEVATNTVPDQPLTGSIVPMQGFMQEGVGCMSFQDRDSCIRHSDGRDMKTFGNIRIRGEACVWCCGRPCQGGNSARCEPKDFLTKSDLWTGEGQTSKEDTCLGHEDADFVQAPEEYDGEKLEGVPFPAPMELDTRTQLSVPALWKPPAEMDIDSDMHTLNGHPSIFLMIASYRDFQCPETITSALNRAMHPGRVVVGVVTQNEEGDPPCDVPDKPCSEDATQAMCRHKSRIHVYKMPLAKAEGPIYARHVGHRMYRGEAFILQVDAHVTFVNNWDDSLIKQWNSTENDYAVISTYLTDIQDSIDDKGRSKRTTRPIMCTSDFMSHNKPPYMHQGAQPEEVPRVRGEPMLHAWWAAGMSFSRGHFVVRVPYDCCAPGVFMGEEISMGVRAWTHGYDLYAPQASVFFHEYAVHSPRRASKRFLHGGGHTSQSVTTRSLNRLTALIKMNPEITDYDDSYAAQYGLGTARPVELFYKIFLIDTESKKSTPLCLFVTSGVMHKAFKPHLRADRKGIDFSWALKDWDTLDAMEEELSRPNRVAHPSWDNEVRQALKSHHSSRRQNM